jgi:hypothetical protein
MDVRGFFIEINSTNKHMEITLREDVERAFKFHKLDPVNDILFARIQVYDEDSNVEKVIELKSQKDGSLNMSEEEFYEELEMVMIQYGYGVDNIRGTIWLTDNRLFIRQEYDGWGHWTLVDPTPPEDIDPRGMWYR